MQRDEMLLRPQKGGRQDSCSLLILLPLLTLISARFFIERDATSLVPGHAGEAAQQPPVMSVPP
jgi:hypothetical protein